MPYPKYNSEKDNYDFGDGDGEKNTKSPGGGDGMSANFAVYSLIGAKAGQVQVLLVEEGFSLQGAIHLAQLYTKTRFDKQTFVAANRDKGVLYGIDINTFIQNFPPPSGSHTPTIVDHGNEVFSLQFNPPNRESIIDQGGTDFINPKLELSLVA